MTVSPLLWREFFALSPFHIAHGLGHLQLMAIEMVPFALLYMIRTFREPGRRNPILAAVFIVLSALSSWYFFIYLFIFGILMTIGRLATRWREPGNRRAVHRLALMAVALTLVMGPLLAAMLYAKMTVKTGGGHDAIAFSADIVNFLAPGIMSAWSGLSGSYYAAWTGMPAENSAYLGYGLLVLSLVGFIKADRLPMRGTWGACVLFFAILSMGPYPHWGGTVCRHIELPYSWLERAMPLLFSFTGCPVRASFATNLSMCILAAGALSWWRGIPGGLRPRYRLAMIAMISLLAAAEFWPRRAIATRRAEPEFFYRLQSEPPDYSIFDTRGETSQMYGIVLHNKPIIKGFVSREPSKLLKDLRAAPFYHYLKAGKVEEKLSADVIAEILRGLKSRDVRYIVREREYGPTVEEEQLRLPRVYDDIYITVFRVPENLRFAGDSRERKVVARDGDGDGVDDRLDNCPDVYNPDQKDSDGTGAHGFASYWAFDEGAGTVTADSIDPLYSTAVTGPSCKKGIVGSALYFDGKDDFLDIGRVNMRDAVTLEAWIKPSLTLDAETRGEARLLLVTGTYMLIWLSGDNPIFPEQYGIGLGFVDLQGNLRAALVTTDLENDRWYHIAATREGTVQRIYIDGTPGEPALNIPGEGAARARDENAFIVPSWKTSGPWPAFRGTVDEVAIHARALSPEEIDIHYQNGLKGRGYLGDGLGDACGGSR